MLRRLREKIFVRRLGFTEAARFNRMLDTDAELRAGLNTLAARFSDIGEEEYTLQMLSLFRRAGLELSVQEFKTLLTLRQKTDQMLLAGRKQALP